MAASRKIVAYVTSVSMVIFFGFGIRQFCCDRAIATFRVGDSQIVILRSVQPLNKDHLYYVITVGGSLEGPFYIGPVIHSSPNLDIALINDQSYCIFNRDHPDDVYCFIDFGKNLYYPSPDQHSSTDMINHQLVAHYRASASLTNLIASPE